MMTSWETKIHGLGNCEVYLWMEAVLRGKEEKVVACPQKTRSFEKNE